MGGGVDNALEQCVVHGGVLQSGPAKWAAVLGWAATSTGTVTLGQYEQVVRSHIVSPDDADSAMRRT